jgi:wyosine [tRNA(Phe)-imidazoG37] synthetase (radical SAM superfamily)
MAYQYIFGPVPSRRLGLSLGVDLTPHKTCTLDCVYCECGKTTHLTLEPRNFFPLEPLKKELAGFLSNSPRLDYVTFSGAGEPTLHAGIGDMVRFIKKGYHQYKLALLTNGTLLYEKEVREKLLEIDLVVVSLDAGSEETFLSINRPHPHLQFQKILKGLYSFRREFKNQLWIEVFMVPGMNTTDHELLKIKNKLPAIQPDKIQINTLDRPGTEPWVASLDKASLDKVSACLKGAEVITAPCTREAKPVGEKIFHQLFATIRRRPCTSQDISRMLGINDSETMNYLNLMLKNNQLKTIQMHRGTFYTVNDDIKGQLNNT